MTRAQVTILLPCLNRRAFLQARVQSLLDQTFTDWEAIVLDGYSTDGSWEFFKSVAATDRRLRLYQLPARGLYAALNDGLHLATADHLHIATCDDTMHPTFLEVLVDALRACPQAGLAVSDVALINRDGEPLCREDMIDYLPPSAIEELLALDTVRSYPAQRDWNYRPPPHDCLLHFSTKSVYFSLTQLLIRTRVARANGPFDLAAGRIADLAWLVRLTNRVGTVHVPGKLASWRFHGKQDSVRNDDSHLPTLMRVLEEAAKAVYDLHHSLLTPNDCAALLLPCQHYLAQSRRKHRAWRCELLFRMARMILERPSTLRAMRAAEFRLLEPATFIPMFMQRLRVFPQEVERKSQPDRSPRALAVG